MTLRNWQTYFRIMAPMVLLLMVEAFIFGTGWSFIPVMLAGSWAVFTLRCMSCGLPGRDHRIATHFTGMSALRTCPNCGDPMVPEQ